MDKNSLQSLLNIPENFLDIAKSDFVNNLEALINDLRSLANRSKDNKNAATSIFRRTLAHRVKLLRMLRLYTFQQADPANLIKEITLLKVIQPTVKELQGSAHSKNIKVEIKLDNPLIQLNAIESALEESIRLLSGMLIGKHGAGLLIFESFYKGSEKALSLKIQSKASGNYSDSDQERDIKIFVKSHQFELAFVKKLLALQDSEVEFVCFTPAKTEIHVTFPEPVRESLPEESGESEKSDFRQRIKDSKNLPTLSTIASRVVKLAKEKETTAAELAGVISKDPALATKILKVVNSAYYSFNRQISTLSQAIAILGLESVRNISLSILIIDSFSEKAGKKFDIQHFWTRSTGAAVAAEYLAEKQQAELKEEAFLAALLQDIGCLILIQYFPEKYIDVYNSNVSQAAELLKFEKDNWGLDHTQIGRFLLQKWNLPELYQKMISFHHNPDAMKDEDKNLKMFIRLINLADYASLVFFEKDKNENVRILKHLSDKYFGLNSAEVDKMMEEIAGRIQEAVSSFNISIKKPLNYSEILNEANIELSERVFTYEQLARELKLANEKLGELNKQLEDQAIRDGLTNIYNHRYLFDFLTKEFSKYNRTREPLSCLMVDIDFFKMVNDTFGHKQGDIVLKEVASILLNGLREGDIVGRYGGEEFVAVLPATEKKGAVHVAERLRKRIEEAEFTGQIAKGQVTVSIGVATANDIEIFDTARELVDEADKALYTAKKNGRNRVEEA